MKDLRHVADEVVKGRGLSANLGSYARGMMSHYHRLSVIKLTMNYYTYHDMLREADLGREGFEGLKRLTDEFNLLMGEFLGGGDGDACIERLGRLRDGMILDMELITAHVDCLRVYEHVLNRVEYRFRDEEFDSEYYDSRLTNDLMHYILSDSDSVSVNSRISEVVEQLPMRLSKNKFYEYLRDSFSLYKGAQVGTVEDFAYNLRSAGMLVRPEGFDTRFPQVTSLCEGLRTADYKNITAEQFKALSDRLTLATEMMSSMADLYVLLAQLVNDLYTIFLSMPYAFGEADELKNGREVMECVLSAFSSGNAELVDEELDRITDVFVGFEGKQERIGQMLSACDHAVQYALENHGAQLREEGLAGCYRDLETIMKLQSGSDFVSLERDDFKLLEASDDKVESICEELIASFRDSFEGMDRMLYRSVMSAVLAQVPVFFNNIDEIQGYINTSLMLCTDVAEKAACVEVLKIIMEG
jgi:hypothetical protein